MGTRGVASLQRENGRQEQKRAPEGWPHFKTKYKGGKEVLDTPVPQIYGAIQGARKTKLSSHVAASNGLSVPRKPVEQFVGRSALREVPEGDVAI